MKHGHGGNADAACGSRTTLAKAAQSSKIAAIFAEFADLASNLAFEAWTKTMPEPTKVTH
jgi:hypothetical protein